MKCHGDKKKALVCPLISHHEVRKQAFGTLQATTKQIKHGQFFSLLFNAAERRSPMPQVPPHIGIL